MVIDKVKHLLFDSTSLQFVTWALTETSDLRIGDVVLRE